MNATEAVGVCYMVQSKVYRLVNYRVSSTDEPVGVYIQEPNGLRKNSLSRYRLFYLTCNFKKYLQYFTDMDHCENLDPASGTWKSSASCIQLHL